MDKIHPENTVNENTVNENTVNENTVEETKTNVSNKTKIYTILKFMKHKFPSFILIVHICISKYVFICNLEYTSELNSTLVVKKNINEHNSLYQSIFWIYLVFMSTICIIWETLYRYCKYKKKKITITKQKIAYISISSLLSLIAFLSTIFYLDDDNVFDCFINYNEVIANVMFFLSYCIIIVVSSFEVYCY